MTLTDRPGQTPPRGYDYCSVCGNLARVGASGRICRHRPGRPDDMTPCAGEYRLPRSRARLSYWPVEQ